MKLVKEHISFERGLSTKRALDLGDASNIRDSIISIMEKIGSEERGIYEDKPVMVFYFDDPFLKEDFDKITRLVKYELKNNNLDNLIKRMHWSKKYQTLYLTFKDWDLYKRIIDLDF